MDKVNKLNLVLVLALIAFSESSLAQDAGLSIKADYPVAEVAERVYVIWGPVAIPNKTNQGFRSNPAFVLTSRGVVVIDPGISVYVGEMVLAKIRAITNDPVTAVFNTHIHGDHWLANHAIKTAFPQAVIYAHPRMKSQAEMGRGETELKRFNELTEGALEGTQIETPDKTANHGDVLRFGDTEFRIHHPNKAHTDNDLMIEVVDKNVLFLGDVARGKALGGMTDGDFKGNIAALDQALGTGAEYFVPGHGPGGGRVVPQAYQAYLKNLYTAVQSLYEEDLTDFEMKPIVAESLGAYKNWFGFDEFLGPHISQAFLEIENEAF